MGESRISHSLSLPQHTQLCHGYFKLCCHPKYIPVTPQVLKMFCSALSQNSFYAFGIFCCKKNSLPGALTSRICVRHILLVQLFHKYGVLRDLVESTLSSAFLPPTCFAYTLLHLFLIWGKVRINLSSVWFYWTHDPTCFLKNVCLDYIYFFQLRIKDNFLLENAMLNLEPVCLPRAEKPNSVILNLLLEQWKETNNILTMVLFNLFEVASNFWFTISKTDLQPI